MPITERKQTNADVVQFLNSYGNVDGHATNEVYRFYREYSEKYYLNPLSAIEFSKQVRRHLNCKLVDKKIQGKKYRIFNR